MGGMVLFGYACMLLITLCYTIEEVDDVKKERDKYFNDFERAKKIHKGLEIEIEKSYAQDVTELYKKVKGKEPSVELIPHYAILIEAYNNLTVSQKKYVDFDIEEIKNNLSKSLELKEYLDKATQINTVNI